VRSAATRGVRRVVWRLAGIGAALLVGCSSSPQSPPPPPASLDAQLAYAAGKAAYHEVRIREAIEHLHHAVHLDRDLLEAQDLLVAASHLSSCEPGVPPCAYPAYGGRPDVWAGLEPDLSLHMAASAREFRRLRAAGQTEEATAFARCAEGLAQLQSEVCRVRSVPKEGRFEGE